jgi:hypothetical protein
MTLVFPSSPEDGEIYGDFYWDASVQIWRNRDILKNLNDLDDVSTPSPSSGQKLRYDGTSWIPVTDNLDSLTNVSAASPATNNKLRWNGSAWVPVTDDLNSLTNVSTSAANGHFLAFNGTSWISRSINATVAQSSGVPTGGIVSRGTNTNGYFVRYADGTQMTWRSISITPVANTVTAATATHAASFSTTTNLAAATTTNVSATQLQRPACVTSLGTASVSVNILRTNTTATTCYVVVTGRWF